jgi:hypothetical protein
VSNAISIRFDCSPRVPSSENLAATNVMITVRARCRLFNENERSDIIPSVPGFKLGGGRFPRDRFIPLFIGVSH